MAIQNVTVTLQGSTAAVGAVNIYPQADGSLTVEVHGFVKDQLGNNVILNPWRQSVQPGQIAALDNLVATALTKIRQSNGLEV